MIQIKATICLEKNLWVGIFERTDKEGFAAARIVFGAEPTDPEVYEFVKERYHELNFGNVKEFKLEIKRINPKRLQRLVKKEMEEAKRTMRPSSFAQDYMREELEKNKKERRSKSSSEKKAYKEEQFVKKQIKKKKKHKGH